MRVTHKVVKQGENMHSCVPTIITYELSNGMKDKAFKNTTIYIYKAR